MPIYSFCLCFFCSFKNAMRHENGIKIWMWCEHKADRLVLSLLIIAILPVVCGEQSAARASSQLHSLSGMTLNSRPPRVKEQTPSLVSQHCDWHTIPVGGPRYSSNPWLPLLDRPLHRPGQSNKMKSKLQKRPRATWEPCCSRFVNQHCASLKPVFLGACHTWLSLLK